MWGCRAHWYALPAALRAISGAVIDRARRRTCARAPLTWKAAKAVQEWIASTAKKGLEP